MTPRLSVLIVSFRSEALLPGCLEAVLTSIIDADLEVIVVDNDAAQFDADAFRARFPTVTFLPQQRNTTYTEGNNIAFAASTGEAVVLLNPDTRVAPDALAITLGRLFRRPPVGGVAALLVGDDGSPQRYYRRLPRLRDVPVVLLPSLLRSTPIGRRYLMADARFDAPLPVEQPPGAFLMLRRPTDDGPILGPGYFNYMSDVDLCDRLTRLGPIVVLPDARCWHAKGGAGVRAATPAERLRLHHDLTWGVRRYARTRWPGVGRAWVEAWILVFWLARISQTALRTPRSLPLAVRTAAAALAGRPPTFA